MTRDEAVTAVRALIAVPADPPVTDDQVGAAVDSALMPDPGGRLPGADGYVATYDVYFAAANLTVWRAAAVAAKGSATSLTSEGSSISAAPPDWSGQIAYFTARSPIARALGVSGIFQPLDLPQQPIPYVPASRQAYAHLDVED